MTASYEVWLTDDAGRRIHLFEKFSSISYNRTTSGYGTCQFIIPYQKIISDLGVLPRPDMRIDIWRSADAGIKARREGSFLIRKMTIYERTTDNMLVLQLDCRSPLDILRRQEWKTDAPITDTIDNMMKTIVSGRFVTNVTAYATAPVTLNAGVYTSTGEFAVDASVGDGPTITSPAIYLHNVLDILKALKDTSFSMNALSPTNKKIYFDVIEDDGIGLQNGFGYRFRTYANLRGLDRTSGMQFSTENGNLSAPTYYEDYLDEITSVFEYNAQQTWLSANAQSADQYLSRWNYIEDARAVTDVAAASALTDIYGELKDKGVKKIFNASFLNSPGSDSQPRSLYGVDWDMGDLLPVKFAGQVFNVEVVIAYVALNDQGVENILGKSTVGI